MEQKEQIRAANISVCSNAILVIIKGIVGISMGSVSVLSEAIHSGIDLLAAGITNVSIRKSSVPADETHRFGHGKFEDIGALNEAILIFIAAIFIIYEAVKKLIIESEIELLGAGIGVMALSALTNMFVSGYLFRIARKYDSIALEADAQHLRTDVYSSVGVLGALLCIFATGFKIIDPIFAILVALLISKTAYKLTRRCFAELVDAKLSDEEEGIIESIITDHYDHYVSYHKLRSRKSGQERFLDLHMVVPRGWQIGEAHRFCDHLEKDIKERIPNLNILIHLEPCDEDCEICQKQCKDRPHADPRS
jgi:cation diffusion facilitator family transporter